MQKTKNPRCWKPQPFHEDDTVFSRRLKTLMNVNKESQHALSKAMGCSQVSVYYWTSGKALPQTLTLLRLKEHYGCSIGYLFGETTHTGIKPYHEVRKNG